MADPKIIDAKEIAKELDKIASKSKKITSFIIKDFASLSKEWEKTMESLIIGSENFMDESMGEGLKSMSEQMQKKLIEPLSDIGKKSFPEAIKSADLFIDALEKMQLEGGEHITAGIVESMRDAVKEAKKLRAELQMPELEAKFKLMLSPLQKMSDSLSKIPLVGGIFEARMSTSIKRIHAKFEELSKDFDGSAASSAKILKGTMGAVWEGISDNIGLIITGLLIKGVLAAVTAIWKRFMDVQGILKKVAESTGIVNDQLTKAQAQIVNANVNLVQYGVTLEKAGEAWIALHDTLGSNLTISKEILKTTSLMVGSLKMAGKDAAEVMVVFRSMAGGSDKIASNMADAVTEASNLAGVAPKKILSDMAKNAKFLQTYFRGSVKEMAAAAISAQRIGLSLDKIGKMTESLLDWDTSIENEMDASVMLGRQLNFQKSRQLMFEGKIKEATEEIMKQIPALDDWNKLNFIQKKAIAKAAGLEVDELTSSLTQQKLLNDMSNEQLVDYYKSQKVLENIRGEHKKIGQDTNALIATEKLSLAWDKIVISLTQILVPTLEAVINAVAIILNFVSNIFSPIDAAAESTQKLTQEWSTLSIVLASVGAALAIFFGPAVIVAAVTGIWGIATALYGAAIAAWTLTIPIAGLTIPIVAVIAAVLALAASVYFIIKYWEPISNFFSELWDGIKSIFSGAVDWIINAAQKYGKYIIMYLFPLSAVYFYWDEIKSFFSGAVDWIINVAQKYGKYIIMALFPYSAVYFYWDEIKSFFSGAVDWIINVAQKYGKYIIMALFPLSAVYFYWDEIKSFFSNTVDWIWNKAQEYGKYIIMAIFPLSVVYFYWDKIKSFFSSAVDWIVKVAQDYGKYIIMALFPLSTVYFYWDKIKAFFSGTVDWIVKIAQDYGKYIIMALFPLSAVYFYWNEIKAFFGDAIKWMISKVTDFGGFFSSVWEGIKSIFSNIWDIIKKGFSESIKNMVSDITNLGAIFSVMWEGIKSIFSNIWDIIKKGFSESIKHIVSDITNLGAIFSVMWEGIKSIFSGIWNAIKQYFSDGIKNMITDVTNFGIIFSMIWEGIKSAFSGIWNSIKEYFSNVIKNMVADATNFGIIFSMIWKGIKAAFGGIWDSIKEYFSNGVKNMIAKVTNFGIIFSMIWEGIKSVFGGIWDSIKEYFSNGVKNMIANATNLGTMFSAIWEGIKSAFMGIWNEINSAFGNIMGSMWDKITGVFGNIVNWLLNIGKNIFDAIKSPFTSAWDFLFGNTIWSADTITSVFKGIIEGIGEVSKLIVDIITLPFKLAFDFIAGLFSGESMGKLFSKAISSLVNAFGPVLKFIGLGSIVDAVQSANAVIGQVNTNTTAPGQTAAGASPAGVIPPTEVIVKNNDEVIKKLDEMIIAMKTGFGVYMDGRKVGDAIMDNYAHPMSSAT